MPYRYSFTNTTKDLLDAHDAHTPRARGVRRLLRLFLILLGLLWFCGPIWLFFTGSPEFDSKKVLTWLIACVILWFNLVRPLLERRKLKRDSLPERVFKNELEMKLLQKFIDIKIRQRI